MKTESMTAEQLLVEKVRQGDTGAFHEVMELYRDRIFNRVYSLLKNREDAEEVTQDAFIRAHRGLANFRGDASFSTWLFQIATNLAHNRYWYWWRRKRDVSYSLEHNLSSDSELSLADVLAADVPNPGEESVTNELVSKVAESLPRLSPKHREILEMRINQNLSYEEIAQKLAISVGTVKSRIARARESLKTELGIDFQ
ncbi:MAG: sigma-70 family RNA polymerase sigma factor [Verrucomicrobiota bacterium]|nr:sigma-70 family RNA polymerase sigma factor [Verrucomicrobiota bacterium]